MLPFDPNDPEHIAEIHKHFPDMSVLFGCQNSFQRIQFRAGMLVMRELILQLAEIDDEEGNAVIDAAAAREMWPTNGFTDEDPGTPRRYRFEELVDEVIDPDTGRVSWPSKTISASFEALAPAHAILYHLGVMKNEEN
jgi:hypothetical protein